MAKQIVTVTDEQIESLEQAAGRGGDMEQVRLCRKALAGNKSAWKACEKAIRNGQG